ncbi:MAG TPA: formyltransferase family protein [Gaiellaceae bacterium]|nr:formyltransferase family protein [Gaiellaceae bacterium]
MRVALLTTDTSHHAYYAWKLAERFPLAAIVLETDPIVPPFEVAHPFEERRDAFEREHLAGFGGPLTELAQVHEAPRVAEAEALLRALSPDAAIVFGTRIVPPDVASISSVCLNLHGGNPEHYRGLDTHLWAIYHGDFANLVTTLHVVDDGLDTGAIVAQTSPALYRGMELHELRVANTQACVELTGLALDALEANGRVPARPQLQRGRYYSFMPSVLKERCVERFAIHTAGL